jgi:hypothetical protein
MLSLPAINLAGLLPKYMAKVLTKPLLSFIIRVGMREVIKPLSKKGRN